MYIYIYIIGGASPRGGEGYIYIYIHIYIHMYVCIYIYNRWGEPKGWRGTKSGAVTGAAAATVSDRALQRYGSVYFEEDMLCTVATLEARSFPEVYRYIDLYIYIYIYIYKYIYI